MATIEVNEKNFNEEVGGASVPVLVDFYASWCMPCRMLAPVLESLSAELDGRVKFAKVDVGDEPELADRYQVRSVPTLMVFRDGKITDTLVGAVGKEQIKGLIGAY
ncbi:MAG: thioredoxin [Bacteroides sp.]|nr:thioredoxin [Eubacterium sp.]MCM1417604.1 thioredoxin [Roseburia sp.]MCM1461685.1 thioredoxin [Bacteroides sp.]